MRLQRGTLGAGSPWRGAEQHLKRLLCNTPLQAAASHPPRGPPFATQFNFYRLVVKEFFAS